MGGTCESWKPPADDAFAQAILIVAILVEGAHPYRAGAGFEIDGTAPDDEDNMLAKRFPLRQSCSQKVEHVQWSL